MMRPMRQLAGGAVLALDTSGDPASACLLPPGGAAGLRVAEPGARAGEALHGLLQSLLQAHGARPEQLGLVAAVRGPGSFTGLRVGLAAAAGLCLATGVPGRGFETTRVIAQASGRAGAILVVLDGGQGRHFVGLHRVADGGVALPLDGPLDLDPAAVLGRIAEVRARGGSALWRGPASPDAEAFLAAGCLRCDGPLAPALAELASAAGAPRAGDPAEELEALYARLPAIRGAAAP